MLPPDVTNAIVESVAYFVQLAVVIVPLFVVAAFLAGIAREYLSPGRVERALQQREEGSGNVAAAAFGAVTPFCSCSSVPVVAGLIRAGAPTGIVFSFLLASPLINEIAVPLLAGLFGVEILALYVGVTFVAAVLGGFVVGRLGIEPEFEDVEGLGSAEQQSAIPDGGIDDLGRTTFDDPATSHRTHVRRAGREAWQFFTAMFPYVLAGIAVAALIHGLVPVKWLRAVLGPENPFAVPLAVVAGVPLYFSLSAMLPVAAALVNQGIPIGTVLALLVGTVGVSLPNLIMLRKLFGGRLLVAYVATIVVLGIAIGLSFNVLPI